MEEEEAASQRIHGRSTCEAFAPGYRFDLRGHFRASFDAPYLITAVEHSVAHDGAADAGRHIYENRFTCIEHALPWRTPRRTPRPRIQGVQTALVVGEPGREIDIDEQGRVHVQFHWDRLGRRDASSSCRVRVSQPGAGNGFGGFFAPRIGQEVIVEFLEGDPDQPLITGRVHNAEQVPPYTDGTQSGVRTRSTPGGSASSFNEIRLEDRLGSELIFVQAERDLAVNVKNDCSESVGNDQIVRIGSNETTSIGGAQTVQVALSQVLNVGANQTLEVGGSQITSVSRDQKVDVGASQSIQVAKEAALRVGRKYVVDAGDELQIKVGSAQIVMRKNGDIVIEGGKLLVKASGDLALKGRRIQQN